MTLAFAAAAGLAGALFVWQYYHFRPSSWSDFDQLWLGSHALLHRKNPYLEVPTAFPWPLYYPLPSLLVTLPFVTISLPMARALFGGLTVGMAAWALARYRPHSLPLLLTGPFLYAVYRGQWSPVVLAACFVPALGAVVAVKPTVGLGAWLYRPSRVALLGAAVLVAVSLVVLPRWPLDWLGSLHTMHHFRSPLLLPWGFVLALAAAKYRRPEARLFLLLSIAPQTVVPYELVPLAVLPGNLREALIVGLGWNLAYLFGVTLNPFKLGSYAGLSPTYQPHNWWAELAFGYLPALVMLLRRPNSARPAS